MYHMLCNITESLPNVKSNENETQSCNIIMKCFYKYMLSFPLTECYSERNWDQNC